ncbi:hypothetical protein ADUPG1_007039 [Aduncisulcus paluster]|uniref:Uncharacterized protein n=1 Tax=Aduncisulcus paluster TaxID=2918883 RepID=A0ABQ5KPY6_9EUKA|nr:hypothetical protein ADUPG1_007039 [Aduncisulcus paluster]
MFIFSCIETKDIFISMSSSSPVIQIVKPKLIHEGGLGCCPIFLDAPNIMRVDFQTIHARDVTKGKVHDKSMNAQNMMKGEVNFGSFTYISIPFSSSSTVKGAYICLYSLYSPPSHILLTFKSSKGGKISKKYKFSEFSGIYWYFLPVNLSGVVLCEITGKGRGERVCFNIISLVFVREETSEEVIACEVREKLWSETPVVKSEFVMEGDWKSQGRDSIPIPRDDPKVIDPSFSMVECKNVSNSKDSKKYDKSLDAKLMLKGESAVSLSHLSIPFPSPNPMKGAYICVSNCSSPALLFTFTDCYGIKTSKKYDFTEPKYYYEWHFLPIDLTDVVLCEIEGKGRWEEKNCQFFHIYSLVFTIPDEIVVAERLSLLPWK